MPSGSSTTASRPASVSCSLPCSRRPQTGQVNVSALRFTVKLGAGWEATIGTSVGVAFADADADVATLIGHADVAMYTAKRNGRHRSVFYEAGLDDAAPQPADPAAEQADALDHRKFVVA